MVKLSFHYIVTNLKYVFVIIKMIKSRLKVRLTAKFIVYLTNPTSSV